MNSIENVTVKLVSDGMIVHRSIFCELRAEYYVFGDSNLYTDVGDEHPPPISLLRLWLLWFGSLPLLATLIYLSIKIFGS